MEHYTVLRTLTQVGGGFILVCRHNLLNSVVVIKRIQINATARGFVAMEVAAYQALQQGYANMIGGAHVLHLYETFQEKQHQHLVLDYCPNGELYDLLKSMPKQRCNPTLAQYYFYQIATGVAFIHAHGLAHRDLSLENIFVTVEGMLK
ncbi:hypothetical protein THRCLA_09755, partial [Thraustotheca clavata]